MHPIAEFETARMHARPMRGDDFEPLLAMYQNDAITATLGGNRTAEQVREYLDDQLLHFARHGYGFWMFHSKADGRFVGRGGLRNIFVGGHDEVEVGYALMPEFWKQGLATEIAQASAEIGFARFELPELVSFTLPSNAASRRVMEKVGFQFELEIVYKELPHVLYRLKLGALLPHGNRSDRSDQEHCSEC
jgi:[ribosomal protein S5]-alanine N-acetyltransferase